jgi:hypothetical protein
MLGTHTEGTEAAKASFQENIRLFGNAQTSAEKYNLYNGLQNLAIAIGQLESRLKKVEDELRRRT